MNKPAPLILTIHLDAESQSFFNQLRKQYFPPAKNLLNAHLTLFHQLPDEAKTFDILQNFETGIFSLSITKLLHLGHGVGYHVESAELLAIHKLLSRHFYQSLIPQDKQGFRPHVTIQNKVSPAEASLVIQECTQKFAPMVIQAQGFDLWRYLDGPWEPVKFYPFSDK